MLFGKKTQQWIPDLWFEYKMRYGPNGEEVAGFIKLLKTLTSVDIERIIASWRDVREEGYISSSAVDSAFAAAGDYWYILIAARNEAVSVAHDHVKTLIKGHDHDASEARADFLNAVMEISVALAAKNLISKGFSQSQFDELYSPWREVIERPETTS